jgi:hypothetical protein
MIRVVHLGDDSTEMATIEVDDFTIEVVYSGIAKMLREAAASHASVATVPGDQPPEARQRRQEILSRILD